MIRILDYINMKNIRNHSFYVLLLMIIMADLNAQSDEKCGYDHLIELQEKQYPGYRDIVNSTFDNAQRYKQNSLRDDVLVIPVIIHIVYQTGFQNIPKEQIIRVMNRLNEDFRHTNENINTIRPEFEDVVGDPMIQFQLLDIKRVSTISTFEFNNTSFPDNVKSSIKGGSDGLNSKKFLNIWVCNMKGGGLLGYAYPPVCAPHWPNGSSASSPKLDGVVVHYKFFNTDNSFITQGGQVINVDGRTLTHEVGHYLGLRHIWGDGASTVDNIPDCNVDDGISDTPNQGLPSNNNCSPFQNTCHDAIDDKNDMIENFMDYSDEKCMSTFTKGQISIMRAILMDCRSDLIDSTLVYSRDSILKNGVVLFPNPTSGRIDITVNYEDVSDMSILVYNEVGKIVTPVSIDINFDEATLDISNSPNGLYFVRLKFGKNILTKKIVLIQ